MKKKVYYKLNRYQVTKVEVETAEQEQAVKMLNREMDRFTKSEDTYYEKCSSLDEMYEESGFEPADDNPNPEEQFIESERQSEIKKQVHKALRQLNPRQQAIGKSKNLKKTTRNLCNDRAIAVGFMKMTTIAKSIFNIIISVDKNIKERFNNGKTG